MSDLRKFVHFAALLVPVLTEVTSRNFVLIGLCIIAGVYMMEEMLRLKGHRTPWLTSFTLKMSRPEETGGFMVRPLYLDAGVILALILVPLRIAYASVVIVAVGDPLAAYIEAKFGRRFVRRTKTLEGLIACLIVSFISVSLFVDPVAAVFGSLGGCAYGVG